jgi:hypothetical protein
MGSLLGIHLIDLKYFGGCDGFASQLCVVGGSRAVEPARNKSGFFVTGQEADVRSRAITPG